jgi:sulfur carrier protein
MEVTFNNQTRQIELHSTIQNALDIWVGEKQKGIAIAVNDVIVYKAQWGSYELQPDDHVLVITAFQGG